MSYDTWKTTDPADATLGRSDGRPTAFRCRDCAWRGRGMSVAREHYQQTGHTVLPADDPRFTETVPARQSA